MGGLHGGRGFQPTGRGFCLQEGDLPTGGGLPKEGSAYRVYADGAGLHSRRVSYRGRVGQTPSPELEKHPGGLHPYRGGGSAYMSGFCLQGWGVGQIPFRKLEKHPGGSTYMRGSASREESAYRGGLARPPPTRKAAGTHPTGMLSRVAKKLLVKALKSNSL